MEFIDTELAGVYIVKVRRIEDERGYFGRAWCRQEFRDHGLNPEMTQLNVGFSRHRGTVRGMHYQLAPKAEAKFIWCARGGIFDVVVDLRDGSATWGRWLGFELRPHSGLMVYSPEGCAHGYQTLEDDTEMYYLTSESYAREACRGVRFDDRALNIRWPLPVTAVSGADRRWPDLLPRGTNVGS